MGPIFMVVVNLGLVAGVTGPVPYDSQTCRARAERIMLAVPSLPGSASIVCRRLSARPRVGEPWVGSRWDVPLEPIQELLR